LYVFLLRRKPSGLPVQRIIPFSTVQLDAGVRSTVQCSDTSFFGISDTKPSG